MDVETWEEACKYLWKGPLTGTIYSLKIEEGQVYYKRAGQDGWSAWVRDTSSVKFFLTESGYINVGENPDHIFLTPQEKVCKKIAVMEQRWQDFQLRKSLQERKSCGI